MKGAKQGLLGVVLVAGLVGCGSGGTDAGGALSLDRLVEITEKVGKDGTDACPLPYDPSRAAEAAKLDQDIEPGPAEAGSDKPAATAEGGRTTDPQSPYAGKAGAWVTCSYHVGGEDLVVHAAGAEAGQAVSLMLPTMQAAAGMSVDETKAYWEKTAKAKPGEPVPSKSGNIATVPLGSGGKGDVALLLTAGDSGKTSLKPEQVAELAKAFAMQAQ
ncbi:hypothetical protein [Streptomyces sp. NPDC058084]|uniref:hypothetical protein n=1 Tax=Streptomyces sp. NPDC058084 TaxID=3346333 RepID=UPI0036E9D864